MKCIRKIRIATVTLGLMVCSCVSAVEPLRTNGASFRIPFAVDKTNSTGAGTAILFSSHNGTPMEPVQRVASSEGSFHFMAPSDGTFQFAVRMTDAQGKLVGQDGALVPELEVIVDSQAPTIQLNLVESGPGKAVVSWTFSEQDIDLSTLTLDYLESSTGIWNPVNIEANRQASGASQTAISSSPGQSIAVRASVKDKAGNQGSGSGQIVLSNSAAANRQSAMNHGLPQFPASPASSNSGLNIPLATSNSGLGTSPFPAVQPPKRPSIPSGSAYGAPSTQISMNSMPDSFGPAGGLAIPTSVPATGNASIQIQPENSLPGQMIAPKNAGLERQNINNRLFDLAYEIDSVGPSGVSSVVLYVTEDNGRSWFKYGIDPDKTSPFKIDTRGEGTFGFAVRVRNGIGFSDPPPQPGEVPTVVVAVDQTPPVLRMARPQVVAQGQGLVRLKWDVQEANPAASSVRLEYSTAADGPWSPVFDWQSDPGGFEIPINPSLPPAIHFRLLARDIAGNVSSTQTDQAIVIDRQHPKARVLGIKPTSGSPGL